FNLTGSIGPTENKTEITCSLGWRQDLLRDVSTDDQVIDIWDGLRRIDAPNLLQSPCATDRDHHHSRRITLPLELGDVFSKRVANDHFFKRDSVAEPQRPRAQTSDRPSSYLDHPRTLFIYSQLGVNRAFGQTHSASCGSRCLHDLLLNVLFKPRWGDV